MLLWALNACTGPGLEPPQAGLGFRGTDRDQAASTPTTMNSSGTGGDKDKGAKSAPAVAAQPPANTTPVPVMAVPGEPTACVPQCADGRCGADGCGGQCACPAGDGARCDADCDAGECEDAGCDSAGLGTKR